jgi:hypothetical protein
MVLKIDSHYNRPVKNGAAKKYKYKKCWKHANILRKNRHGISIPQLDTSTEHVYPLWVWDERCAGYVMHAHTFLQNAKPYSAQQPWIKGKKIKLPLCLTN